MPDIACGENGNRSPNLTTVNGACAYVDVYHCARSWTAGFFLLARSQCGRSAEYAHATPVICSYNIELLLLLTFPQYFTKTYVSSKPIVPQASCELPQFTPGSQQRQDGRSPTAR